MIDEDIDSSGYDPSSEEEEMQDDSRGQGNQNAEKHESTVGKQTKVGGEKARNK